jgi:hypothetical protein
MKKAEEPFMTYIMEQDLKDYINNQRKEAEEFSKQPGCWMGAFPHPNETRYWSERVPSGTLKEWYRTQLEEDAYYLTAEKTSKSYARSLDFSNWTDERIERHMDRICSMEAS